MTDLSVSIIIPVYNVESYIVRCLQSVMAQTYDGPIECLLVDDDSIDNTTEVVERALAGYDGHISFKVLHHEKNRGQSAARNTGTKAAIGDYVYYLDSDDAMTPDCLALMVKEVEKHSGVEMVIGAYKCLEDKSEREVSQYSYGAGYFDDNAKIRLLFFKEGFGFSSVVWNKLIKRDFIISNSLLFKEGVIHEDDHWCFYAYKKLNIISIIEEVTYLYHIRGGSTMTALTNQKTAVNLCAIIEDWVDDFDGFGRSLQVYLGLELLLMKVYPYLPKKETRRMYMKFFVELLRMREYKIVFYFAVNRFVKWRYFKLTYKMIPKAYREESKKLTDFVCSGCH